MALGSDPPEFPDGGQETRLQLIGKMGSGSQKAPGSASRAYTVTGWVLGGLPWVQAERLR